MASPICGQISMEGALLSWPPVIQAVVSAAAPGDSLMPSP